MNYYLCTFVGSGDTPQDAIRPVGVDALPIGTVWSVLDLRDVTIEGQTATDGYCIVAAEEVINHKNAVSLGDGAFTKTDPAAIAAVESALSVTLDPKAMTPATIVEDLLVNHGTDPADDSKWNTVDAKDERVEIWLGGEKVLDKLTDDAGVISADVAAMP